MFAPGILIFPAFSSIGLSSYPLCFCFCCARAVCSTYYDPDSYLPYPPYICCLYPLYIYCDCLSVGGDCDSGPCSSDEDCGSGRVSSSNHSSPDSSYR